MTLQTQIPNNFSFDHLKAFFLLYVNFCLFLQTLRLFPQISATRSSRRKTKPRTVCLFKHLDLMKTLSCANVDLNLTFEPELHFCAETAQFLNLQRAYSRKFRLTEKLLSALLIEHSINGSGQVFTNANAKDLFKQMLLGRFHRNC